MIYFIRSGQYVKIGKADNVAARVASLQVASPTPLELIVTIPGSVKVERALHAYFSAKQTIGEWFLLTDEEVKSAADEFRAMEAGSLEEAMGRQNWLSVLTFDVYKYARAGGAVVVEWTADGLELRLSAVGPETEGVNAKFARAFPVPAPAAAEEPTP